MSHGSHQVTFRVSAPAAAAVALSGDWPNGTSIPMSKGADGVWTATVGPLKSEMYTYAFVSDGLRARDTRNSRFKVEFTGSLVADVIPFVEAHYRVLANRENRAVAGLSMGGAQALYVGLRNIDRFAWVGGFSGAFVLWPGARAATTPAPGASGAGASQGLDTEVVEKVFPGLAANSSKLRLFYLSIGLDDFLLASNRQFKQWLDGKKIKHEYIETPGYAHVWSYWRINLADMAPRLFR